MLSLTNLELKIIFLIRIQVIYINFLLILVLMQEKISNLLTPLPNIYGSSYSYSEFYIFNKNY